MVKFEKSKKIKIAILGASGIGKFHVRNFSKLNVVVDSILSSSKARGNLTSKELNNSLGLDIDNYEDLDSLLIKSSPEAVVIATPNTVSYTHLTLPTIYSV
mgnify:CR=1 FL=1